MLSAVGTAVLSGRGVTALEGGGKQTPRPESVSIWFISNFFVAAATSSRGVAIPYRTAVAYLARRYAPQRGLVLANHVTLRTSLARLDSSLDYRKETSLRVGLSAIAVGHAAGRLGRRAANYLESIFLVRLNCRTALTMI